MSGKKKEKVKIGEEITAGKDGKQTQRKDIEIDPPKPAEKAEVAPAIEPEQIVTVRGTSVGGTRQMVKSEYDKWQKEQNKTSDNEK